MNCTAKNRTLWLAALPLLWFPALGPAQRVMEIKGFKLAEYYRPPHETQLKSLLESARALPQPDGRTFLNLDNKLQTFSENGQPEIIVRAPQCLYDSSKRAVNSAGPLRVETADGKFLIEGEGFLWEQTNSILVISNNVHTTAYGDALAAPGSAKTATGGSGGERSIEIFSEAFDYSAATGLANYRRTVRVTGTNLDLKAAILTLKVPVQERQLHGITADTNVVVVYNDVRAEGQHAVYAPDSGRVTLTGQPSWQAGPREGHADELTIDRTNKIFYARGGAWLRMPGDLARTGFMAEPEGKAASSAPPTNSFVEVRSGDYEIRTNAAFFRDQVRVQELAGAELKGTMRCARMNLAFAGTNELQTLVAEDKVVFEEPGRELAGDKAVYTAANQQMVLTGSPTWRVGDRDGKGDLILVNARQNEIIVRGNASMRLPASQLGQSGAFAARRPAAPSKGGAVRYAEIFSREYQARADTAVFRGGVYITHPQMNWACETVTVQLPAAGGRIESILADEGVTFEMLDEQGRKIHGAGDKATYASDVAGNVTNDIVRLVGNPASLETTNGTIRNNLLVLDLGRGKLIATGDYSIRGTAPATATNNLELLKGKILK